MSATSLFVGRSEELHRLSAGLESPGVALVHGEAGIGKSRFLAEFVKRNGWTALWARAMRVAGPNPYELVIDLVEQLSRMSDAASEVNDEKRQWLDELVQNPARYSPRQVAARLRGLLSAVSDLITIAEDLHEADELSCAVIGYLARSIEDDGLRLVVSYRTGQVHSPAFGRLLEELSRTGFLEVALPPLAEASSASLVRGVIGPAASEMVVAELVHRCEGVPLFLEELSRAASTGDPPSSLELAVQNQLDGLPHGVREVLEEAAVVGNQVDPDLLSRCLDVALTEVVKALEGGLTSGLLVDAGEGIGFRHGLIRDLIVGNLPSPKRRLIHHRVAEALIQRNGKGSRKILAEHLFLAGRVDESLAALEAHGLQSLEGGAIEEASDSFKFIIEVTSDSHAGNRVKRHLAECLFRRGYAADAIGLLEEVLHAYLDGGSREDVLIVLHRMASMSAIPDPAAAIEYLDRAIALLADEGKGETKGRFLARKGYILAGRLDDAAGAEPLLLEALETASVGMWKEVQVEATEALAWVEDMKSRPASAADFGRDACALALELGDDELVARTHSSQAVRLASHGRIAEALSALATSMTLLQTEAREHVAAAEHLRAWIHWHGGNPAAADHSASLVEATGYARIYGRIVRAWALAQKGEIHKSKSIVSRWWEELGPSAREDAMNTPDVVGEAAQAMLCEVIVWLETSEADESLLRVVQQQNESWAASRPDPASLAVILLVGALLRHKAYERAREHLAMFEADARFDSFPLRRGQAAELSGLLHRALGDFGKAREDFERAIQWLSDAENKVNWVRCTRLLAELRIDRGEQVPIETLQSARAVSQQISAHTETRQIDSLLRRLGIRPRAGRPKGSGAKRGELTPREREVVALVAAGLSNRSVSAQLFISERTVEGHLSRAQKRLGVEGRAAVAAWAAKNGLV